MIVLFIESDLIRSQSLPENACPNCGKSGGLEMELRQRYAEFSGARVYPKGVFGVVHCLRCGHVFPASRWTEVLHQRFVSLKSGYKTPRSYWQGLIRVGYGVVAFFLIFTFVMFQLGRQRQSENQANQQAWQSVLEHPRPGTTLAVGPGDGSFAVFRVIRAGNGAVWLKKYVGERVLTDFFHETGWGAMPDSEFATEALEYSAAKFADKCLIRSQDIEVPTQTLRICHFRATQPIILLTFIEMKGQNLNDPKDFEYSGRRSRYPPFLELLGYFGLGIGSIFVGFDRLREFSKFENTTLRNGLRPIMQVHWLEKLLYESGGKYAVFGFGVGFGLLVFGFGGWRLWRWLKLRNEK